MTAELTPRARAHLRSLAHSLKPVVQVGSGGVTESVCRAVSVALEDHELIKIRIIPGYVGDRKEAATEIARRTGSQIAQIIGRMVVLYRRRARENAKRPRIRLP
jgi:RNA-binding protein